MNKNRGWKTNLKKGDPILSVPPLPPLGSQVPLLNPNTPSGMQNAPAGGDSNSAMGGFMDDPFDQPVTNRKQDGPQ